MSSCKDRNGTRKRLRLRWKSISQQGFLWERTATYPPEWISVGKLETHCRPAAAAVVAVTVADSRVVAVDVVAVAGNWVVGTAGIDLNSMRSHSRNESKYQCVTWKKSNVSLQMRLATNRSYYQKETLCKSNFDKRNRYKTSKHSIKTCYVSL